MGNVLGIDVGASYVKAVYISGGGSDLQPVLNRNSDCMFRMCGVAGPDGSIRILTKDEDRQHALEKGELLVENVKPLRGENKRSEDLEIAVLKEVLECYREQSRNFDLTKLDSVTLTHPVSHRPSSVEALKRIAVAAGLPASKLDTIEEPVALGLFAKHLKPDMSGHLFIIDAGHYTTDFVTLTFQDPGPAVRSANYLSLRLGVAELCHRLGRSVWLKAQMAGGFSSTSLVEAPFDESGPEASQPIVQKLSAWAESNIIRAMGIGFFGPDDPIMKAHLVLSSLAGDAVGSLGAWREKVNIIYYMYDFSSAKTEELSRSYPHHNKSLVDRIFRENYRETTRPIIRAICAATLGVLLELPEASRLQIALGGGMSLVPEVREALSQLVRARGLEPPIDLNYPYTGLGPLAVGRLLSVASGAAIAASERFTRVDTLSDTLGILVWYELEDALAYLDSQNSLPEDFDPGSEEHLSALHAKSTPGNVVIVPLHRVLAERGTELPVLVEFPDDLVVLSRGGTLNVTRYGDNDKKVSPITPAASAGGGIVAQIKVPRPADPETPLRLSLEISRNDVWQLSIRDSTGRTVVKHEIVIDLKGRASAKG